jgi:hypothetical protein
MPLVAVNMTALVVATIFYAYRDRYAASLHRAKLLRERVAYMLWSSAQPLA